MHSHGYCTTHGIAYNRTLDFNCPQCVLAHLVPAKQLDFDSDRRSPVDASGNLLNTDGSLKPSSTAVTRVEPV